MEKGFLSLFITLASLLCSTSSQRCLESRLDYNPCSNTMGAEPDMPSSNHYRIARTDLTAEGCRIRDGTEYTNTIQNFNNMKVISSPIGQQSGKYPNRLLVHYNVKCENEENVVYFNFIKMELQDAECINHLNNAVCEDYIEMERKPFGTDEFCGNNIPAVSAKNLGNGNFKITFRTSEMKKKKGFLMYAICFKEANTDNKRKRNAYVDERCFNVKEFNSPVCTGAPIQEVNNKIYTKLDVFSDVAYFPGCERQSPLEFFRQQKVQRRSCHRPTRVVKRYIIKKNEMIQFCHSLLCIIDEKGQTRSSYGKVSELHTLDENGKTEVIYKCTKTPLTGPGELNIFGERAYINLFKCIDPKGNLPNKEEQVELKEMVISFLTSVPNELYQDTNDTFDDDDKPLDNITASDPPECIRISKIPTIVNGSREIGNGGNNRTAFLAALRNQNACNPVLRAGANAILTYFRNATRFNQTEMEALKKFAIQCTQHSNCTLSCKSDSTTLTGRTLCMVPDETFMCEPFADEPVNITDYKGKTMKVRAVNCNGQQAEVVIRLE